MVINLVILFAFLAMLSWGFGDFFIQKSVKKLGIVGSLAWIGVIGSIVLLPLVFKDFGLLKDSTNLIIIVGLGVLTFVSAIFDFKALKDGKLSVVDVVIEMELPITIALSFIFLNEVLSGKQLLIVLFIFVGVVLTAIKSFSHFKSKIEKGVFMALVAALFFGILNVAVGFSAKTISPILVIWGSWVVFTIISLVFIVARGEFKKFISQGVENGKLVLVTGVVDTFAWVFYALALEKSKISLVTAITESYPAVALFLGVMINKEKVALHQYVGAVIAIACSVLLSMTI